MHRRQRRKFIQVRRKLVVHLYEVGGVSIAAEVILRPPGKITMVKEATELVTARAALGKAEKDLGDPATFIHLKNGIVSLLGMISGDSRQIEKDLARKLLLTYRNKVLSEVKAILGDLDSHEPESLSHWNKVMEVFVDAGVEDPEFNACREKLITKCSRLSIDGLKPGDLDAAEKELREVLNSLSAHRSRLSNIKWSIRK